MNSIYFQRKLCVNTNFAHWKQCQVLFYIWATLHKTKITEIFWNRIFPSSNGNFHWAPASPHTVTQGVSIQCIHLSPQKTWKKWNFTKLESWEFLWKSKNIYWMEIWERFSGAKICISNENRVGRRIFLAVWFPFAHRLMNITQFPLPTCLITSIFKIYRQHRFSLNSHEFLVLTSPLPTQTEYFYLFLRHAHKRYSHLSLSELHVVCF